MIPGNVHTLIVGPAPAMQVICHRTINTETHGTRRGRALGGAQSACGGDITCGSKPLRRYMDGVRCSSSPACNLSPTPILRSLLCLSAQGESA